ncbi:MAG: coproporphyrinogen dehydrogenase HemZ [Clostridia bacterium]|nr:coproporphyrinogen dehydrogenase HemZ [Clostridia bacterium]
MYRFIFNNIDNTSQYEELIKEFLQPSDYGEDGDRVLEYDFRGDKEDVKRQIYRDLSAMTGKSPKWGILTGIRPVKLAGEIADRSEDPKRVLMEQYLVHESKADLVCDILQYQREKAGKPASKSLSVYVGIPFCPTRCLYCSFTSNQVEQEAMEPYLEALGREIDYAGTAAKAAGYSVETLYFGGGTPTSLNEEQLDRLLTKVSDAFALGGVREYTVEAGRPDTITEGKLRILTDHGVDRISINPQSMKQKTLDLIGRRHTVDDVYEAFAMAHKAGVEVINADLIAGLPEETEEDFANSLDEIIRLGAGNITLHTLAVKRASRLKEMDENFNYKDEELREQMLAEAHETLRSRGYQPYYLYRQKHTSGNTENIGFTADDRPGLYNIRIMEEAQSNLALGAGGISKIYFPSENRLERVANVSNYEIYIDRIDEMIERKRKGFFEQEAETKEEQTC